MVPPANRLNELNMEILEVFFPSEDSGPKGSKYAKTEEGQKPEDEFEIRRKLFFRSELIRTV